MPIRAGARKARILIQPVPLPVTMACALRRARRRLPVERGNTLAGPHEFIVLLGGAEAQQVLALS